MLCSRALEHLEIERRANLPSFTHLLHVTPNRSILCQRHKPCAHLPCSHLSCTKKLWKPVTDWMYQAVVTMLWKAIRFIHHWDFKILLQLHLVCFWPAGLGFHPSYFCSRCWKSRWQWAPNLFEEAALLVVLDRAPVSFLLSYSTFSEDCSIFEWVSVSGTAISACRD